MRPRELRGLVCDAVSSGAWQGSVSIADLAQIALVTHFLGLAEFGRLALAVAFVTLVARALDLRVAPVIVAFGARRARDDMQGVAGVFQFGYLVDAVTGVVAFAVVASLSPFVGPALVGDDGALLVLLYAASVLASTLDDSSHSVLRLLDRFGLVAASGVALEVLRVVLVAGALVVFESLAWVVGALIAYQLVGATVRLTAARAAFRRASGGERLFHPALARVRDERRAMLGMLLHTNAVSYARIAQTQLPTILVGALAGATNAGLYKIGMSAAGFVGRLSDPLYLAVLPRLARLWAAGQRAEVRRLLAGSTALSTAAMAVALALVVLFRSPIVEALGGGANASPATATLVLGAAAYALNGVLFWNAPLLYAMERPATMTRVAAIGLVVQLGLLAILVPQLEAPGAAAAFLASAIATNLAAAAWALSALREPRVPRLAHEPVLDHVS